MKAVVAGVVVLAFCAVQTVSGVNNLNTLQAGIARQKNTVQSTVNRLERHKRDFSFDLTNKLSNLKINSMQEINSIVNPTIKNIEDAAKESTAGGKDASGCYENARLKLREFSLNGFDALEDCRNDALSSVKPAQANVDATILASQQIITYLDSIFPSCYSTSVQQMELCIVGKLPEATQLVNSIQTTADAVISSANSAAGQAQIISVNCNRGPVSAVRGGAIGVQRDADRCITAL